ncbi:signal peptidase I [Enterococcus sp. AZ194]|uniref:signal peptidase I n=1 Tax=Enterococcus sp. AZ194 TaxID=2774629 RepID=UPI003F24D4D4
MTIDKKRTENVEKESKVSLSKKPNKKKIDQQGTQSDEPTSELQKNRLHNAKSKKSEMIQATKSKKKSKDRKKRRSSFDALEKKYSRAEIVKNPNEDSVNKEKKSQNKSQHTLKKKRNKPELPKKVAVSKKKKQAYLQEKSRERVRKKRARLIFESALLTVGLMVLLFALFKLRIHKISGASMEPVLNDKELVLIERTKDIQRGELLVFKRKGETAPEIKRVIGLSGDAIWISGQTLYLNPYVNKATTVELTKDKLPSGTFSIELIMEDLAEVQDVNRIPAGSYFVLGDNSDKSVDSRTFGFVTKEMILGKVF